MCVPFVESVFGNYTFLVFFVCNCYAYRVQGPYRMGQPLLATTLFLLFCFICDVLVFIQEHTPYVDTNASTWFLMISVHFSI